MAIKPLTLDRVLSEGVIGAKRREASFYDESCGDLRETVLYGAGKLGRKVLRTLTDQQASPIAICDANPDLWGTFINGVPIMAPAEAVKHYGDTAVFVICTWSPGSDRTHSVISEYLKFLGCHSVVSFIPLFWKYHESCLPYYRIDLPHKLMAAKDHVLGAFDLLEDERSRDEFVCQVQWLIEPQLEALKDESVLEDIYFPRELFSLLQDEYFVDCGAFDGDTIDAFLKASNNVFRGIHAFEPDPSSYELLRRYVNSLAGDVQAKIIISDKAVSDVETKYMMDARGELTSCISDLGSVQISSLLLDRAVTERVSYIKMDLEGFETQALEGATRIIQEDAPRLAISIYHRQDHLWNLPLQIKSYNQGYKLHLRRHGGTFGDVVCYALPRE